jgi:hypothetical protein
VALDLQSQLDALREAYYSGTRRVSYSDKSVEYASLAEMREAIASLEAQLGATPSRNIIARPRRWA